MSHPTGEPRGLCLVASRARALPPLYGLGACLALLGCTGLLDGAASNDTTPGAAAGTTGATAAAGADTAGSGSTAGASSTAVSTPGPRTLPHLTVAQYRNAVRGVFGASIVMPQLESDNNPDFYAVIGAAREPLSENAVSMFWQAAQS